MLSRPAVERYWKHVITKPTGCWDWDASTIKGYGRLSVKEGGKYVTYLAHRISYELHIGDPGDALVLHRCSNRRCSNPYHLYLAEDQKAANHYKHRERLEEAA